MSHRGMRVVGISLLVVIGAPACERQLRPPSGAGRISLEGLPIATSLPSASMWCIVTYQPPTGASITASWDAPTRTLAFNGRYWTLDAGLHVVEEGQSDGRYRMIRSYDAHGVPTSYRYEEYGQTLYSYDQENEYDAAGVLVASERVYTSSVERTAIAYQYAGQHLTGVTMKHESEGQTWDFAERLTWDGERVVAREQGDTAAPDRRDVRSYDAGGRLIQADTDFGFIDAQGAFNPSDGTLDVRFQWTLDAAGRVTASAQDGTYALPPPGLDGVPDEIISFEPACAEIAVVPVALYQIESWLAPQ
jgi:hypothetical protein